MDITVIGPRKDLTDQWRNRVHRFTRAQMVGVPYVTGTYQHDGGPNWSMSRALNAGRRRATTRKLLLTPTDYLLPQGSIARASQVLDDHPWWAPFTEVIVLDQATTARILNGNTPSPDEIVTAHHWDRCLSATAIRTEVFDDVGGMDPRFAGWGPEDFAFRRKLEILYGPPPPPEFVAVELWAPPDGTPNREHNEALFVREYNVATAEEIRATIARAATA